MAGLSKLIKAATSGSKEINKRTQKQMDELVQLRRQRAADSRMSTVKDDVPSAKERALEDALRKKGVGIPGTSKRTAKAGSPLTEIETNKMKRMANKVDTLVEKGDDDGAGRAYDAFVDYESRLIEKYGTEVERYTGSIAPSKYDKGGDVKKPKKKNKDKIGIMIAVGKVKKPEMQYGGTVNGKRHMYAAGGEVKMNPGLKALQKASPEAFNKITGK